MKVLFLDIETSPNTAHVWGLWQNNVSLNQLLESSYILCWAAKWHDKKKVMFNSVYHSSHDQMLKEIHALLDEADVAIHYHGKRFDIPTLNKEFLLAGMNPPSPYRQVDLLDTVRHRFRFPSNKLDYVAQRLGVGKKFDHEGHTLWIKCMNDDPKAWATMKKYNMGDVVLLEKVYDKLLPWVSNHPNRAVYDKNHPAHSCPACGSTNVKKEGFAYTTASRWQRYSCKDCGAWSRGERLDLVKGTLKQV